MPMEKAACITNTNNVYLTDQSASTMSTVTTMSMITTTNSNKNSSASTIKLNFLKVLIATLTLMNLKS